VQKLFNYLISGTPKSQIILGLIVSLLMTPLIFIMANIKSPDRQTERKPAYVFMDENFKQNLFFKVDRLIDVLDRK